MLSTMPRLSQVLHAAVDREASEIIFESGQPVVITTSRGPEPLGDVVAENELFEALTEVLGPEDQAELAVGNVLSFEVDLGHESWTLVTEPGPNGIIVRGLPSNGRPAFVGDGVELPVLDNAEEVDVEAPAGSNARWKELAADEVGGALEDLEIGLPELGVPDDDDDFEMEVSSGEEVSFAGVAEADPSESDEVSFADITPEAVGSAPTLAMSAAGEPSRSFEAGAGPPELTPPGAAAAAAAAVSTGLSQHAGLIEPGMLVFLQGTGLAEHLAEALGVESHVLEGEQRPDPSALRPGTMVVVRCEEPSRHLGWVLHRLEEGVRVVIETQALTPEGARRILLGVGATPRAEAWLDQRPVRWFAPGPSGWIVL